MRAAEAYRMLNHRIGIFASLPIGSLSRISLRSRLDAIDHGERAGGEGGCQARL